MIHERVIERDRVIKAPIATVWQVIANTARLNQGVGSAEYEITEEAMPDGTVRRTGRGKLIAPFQCEWQEHFGEWVPPNFVRQHRTFTRGPLKTLTVEITAIPEGDDTRLSLRASMTWTWWLTTVVSKLGLLDKAFDVRKNAVNDATTLIQSGSEQWSLIGPEPLSETARRRLDTCRAELRARGHEADQIERLIDYLQTVPFDVARRVRPLALSWAWNAAEDQVIALCLAASNVGLLALSWDLLCPRCRGAKLKVATLYSLPKEAHCSSCNIDYGRDFARNIELTFRPERWLRELPEGEFCLQGAATTPHVLAQRRIEPGSTIVSTLRCPPGDYRIRTVEAGDAVDVALSRAGDAFPLVTASDTGLATGPMQAAGAFAFHNATHHVLHAVLEDRSWAADALTGERVIAMPVFRELCPEQILRAGDEIEISRVTLLFSDLKGSTGLYERIGDSAAYALVRQHFALLAEIIREHHGVLIKTMGDAVMAAFYEPADAARAVLTIKERMAHHNADHPAQAITLKLGLHAGRCIAVTAGGVLDYFGGAVNLTARLEAHSEGDDVVVSAVLAADPAVAAIFDGLPREAGSAQLRGFVEPVPFVRLRPCPAAATSDS